MKRIIKISILILSMSMLFSGCEEKIGDYEQSQTETNDGNQTEDPATVIDPSEKEEDMDTVSEGYKKITLKYVEFELPDTWEKVTEHSNEVASLFKPSDIPISAKPSNVVVEVHNSNIPAPKLSDVSEQDMLDIAQSIYPNADKYEYIESFSFPIGGAFQVDTHMLVDNIEAVQSQYFVVVDNYAIIVYATYLDDNISPSPNEVAKGILQTMSLTAENE